MINTQKSTLLNIIKNYPEGIKEYDLLTLIQEKKPKNGLTYVDNLDLFKRHFLLFHTLYQLDEQLRTDHNGQLVINALNIQWLPKTSVIDSFSAFNLDKNDSVRAFYLDLKNLEDTSSEDVENLLTSFWLKMEDDSEKVNALTLFELNEPCDLPIIKKRYRQLLTMHHPDKGGSIETTQALNKAMEILKRCYA